MLRTARLLFVLAVTAGMLVLTPQTSWACSCVSMTTAELVKNAGTVVDAKVDWVATNGITTTYSVKVSQVYKGKAAEKEKLTGAAQESACGLGSLVTDKRYLIYIHGKHPGAMGVSTCSGGAVPYDAALASRIEKITGEPPTGPYATPGSRPGAVDEDPIAGTAWYTVVITGLIVAGALGFLIWIRRPTRS
ncbi:hypothetical protein [Nocardioides marmorisolisilvae]|uniref:Tissue inhibitor of metalloproteinase n=1 Tax=Nocardioides marmorisolisilvae TaxID=1542737 RepID=A0A3N0E0X9_9ACTN|nr:hypothetical protein [Nocardioides marmorisolisilvae]RNL81403.1 hypothetical protein EFL95_03460 [Nocardioides marmorisolisilvae]